MNDKIIGYNYESWMICPRCNQKYGKSNLAFHDVPIYYGCGCLPPDRMYFINTDKMEVEGILENFTVTEPMKPSIYKKQELLPILAMAALAFVAVIALCCAVTAQAESPLDFCLKAQSNSTEGTVNAVNCEGFKSERIQEDLPSLCIFTSKGWGYFKWEGTLRDGVNKFIPCDPPVYVLATPIPKGKKK